MAPARRNDRGFHRQPLPRARPAVHELVGRRLRLHYEELQLQPLPTQLTDLLAELDDIDETPPRPRRA